MRLLTLGLLGLLLVSGPALATAPSQQPARSAGPAKAMSGKPMAARSGPAAAKAAPGQAPARLQQAAWRPGATPATCYGKTRHCRGAVVAPAPFAWTQGLPAPAGVQASECPDGTLATLARGHEDVVRCMPI